MNERYRESRLALERDLPRNVSILGFMENNPLIKVYHAGRG